VVTRFDFCIGWRLPDLESADVRSDLQTQDFKPLADCKTALSRELRAEG
jgi:hypothetical protein